MPTEPANPLRVAIGGFALESVSFLPGAASVADFDAVAYRGGGLADGLRGSQSPGGGFIDVLDAEGVEIAPLTYTDLGAGGNASDEAFEHFRDEVPHLKRRPSEYVKEQFWFTTQPSEEPDNSAHLRQIIDWIGVDRLIFSSDYPHVEGGRNPIKRFEESLADSSEHQKQRFYFDNFVDLIGSGLPQS